MTELSTAEKCEQLLDQMAKNRAATTGEPYHKAYAAVLNTDDGKFLYAKHYAEKGEAERGGRLPTPTVELAASSSDSEVSKAAGLEDQLDDLARRYSKDHRVDLATAYDRVLASAEGRAMYAEVCGHRTEAERLIRSGR